MDRERTKELIGSLIVSRYGGRNARLAEALRVNASTVGRWRKGELSIDSANLEKLSNITEIPVDDLLKCHISPSVLGAMGRLVGKYTMPASLSLPDEMQKAVAWQIGIGEDPDCVSLAARKAIAELPPGETFSAAQYALLLESWLERMAALR